MAACFATVTEEEICKLNNIYTFKKVLSTSLVNTKTTVPLNVGP